MRTGQEQIASLTGLRGAAALWVMLMHFREITPTRVWHYPVLDTVIANGAYGVDVFFVLSGFILYHVYGVSFETGSHRDQARQFILYRFARIYPVHLVTFGIMLALLAVKILVSGSSGVPDRYDFLTIATTLTLTHAWIPGLQTPNMPAWSISAEWFAYLLFPWLAYFLSSRRWAGPLYVATGVALALFQPLGNYCLTHVLSGFLVGMAAYRVLPTVHRIDCGHRTGLCVVAAILVWAWRPVPHVELGLLLFAALIVVLNNPEDLASRALSTRGMIYLGEISYSLYMIHWPARIVVRNALAASHLLVILPSPVVASGYVLVALSAAAVSFHFVELPGRALLRNAAALWLPTRSGARVQTRREPLHDAASSDADLAMKR